MARVTVRFKHSHDGIHEVLTSAGVQTLLHVKGEAVAAAVRAAGIRVEGEPGDIELPVSVDTTGRGVRARTFVAITHPSGLAVESEHRILARSLDAARTAG